jgi:predicted NAD/FAD-dependent oxidoreductase
MSDLVVVGAGVAGLSLARALARRGGEVLVLEKSRGLGGRCATRRVEGQPVDHGLPMLHGRSPSFVEELLAFASSGVTPIFDWPHHVRGEGTPCQPQAFRSLGVRLAVREGVSAFAKYLARQPGLGVELETEVRGISVEAGGFRLETTGGERRASTLILTPPVDQTLELLCPLAETGEDEIAALCETLRTVHALPCLTLIAGYREAPALDLHLRLPGPPSPIHSILSDGSKRGPDAATTLVVQAQPAFSRAHLEEPAERWAAELLGSCGELLGDWASRPSWQQAHRWRFARVARGSELSHASLLRFPGGARLGLCGDAFHPAGGLEGAYLSGLELAARIGSDAATLVGRPGTGRAPTLSSARG